MGEVVAGPGFRTCAHSGCQWPPVATLSFQYATKRIWLVSLRPGRLLGTYDLCSVHLDRFRPPLGWEVLRNGHGEPAAEPAETKP